MPKTRVFKGVKMFSGAKAQQNMARTTVAGGIKGALHRGGFAANVKYVSQFSGMAGTTSKSRKAFMNMDVARERGVVREVFHHEKFHTVPIVGRSEILAHFYGGLRGHKGRISPKQAMAAVDMLRTNRPGRFNRELRTTAITASAVGAAGGTAYAVKKKPDQKVVFRRVGGRIVPIKVRSDAKS